MKQLKVEEANVIRTRRTSTASSSSSTTEISITPSSLKKYLAGRPIRQLSEFEQDTIRLIFHQPLNEKVYLTVSNMLKVKIQTFQYNRRLPYAGT